MGTMPYRILASVIHKQRHKEKYGDWAANPYDLALEFALERLLPLLESAHQTDVLLVAEARGKREDDELNLSFLRIINEGTSYIRSERFRKTHFSLTFMPKSMNIIGTQMADLVAYPIARYALNPHAQNPAYQVVKENFYVGPGSVRGLKIFP